MDTLNNKKIIIGICGREGAGKSTIAEYFCNNIEYKNKINMIKIDNSLLYIISIIFGWDYYEIYNYYNNNKINEFNKKDVIWNFNLSESIEIISKILNDFMDFKSSISYIPDFDQHIQNEKYIEYSLSIPLKKIASVLVNFIEIEQKYNYEILKGDNNYRDLRENIITDSFKIGKMTGRQTLEYIGTDIFRKVFDNDIWIKIFERDILSMSCSNIIIPDIRFENEKDIIEKLGGYFILVYKSKNDLLISDNDRKQHISKWSFLNFYKSINKIFLIKNNKSKKELFNKLNELDFQ